jgi:hypothetical protein
VTCRYLIPDLEHMTELITDELEVISTAAEELASLGP